MYFRKFIRIWSNCNVIRECWRYNFIDIVKCFKVINIYSFLLKLEFMDLNGVWKGVYGKVCRQERGNCLKLYYNFKKYN